jgi:hypothetical protein
MTKELHYIGIDTGWSGAIAIYDGKKFQVWDCPNPPKRHNICKSHIMLQLLRNILSPKVGYLAMIEEPFARSRKSKGEYDSGCSMLSYGTNFGSWVAHLISEGINPSSVHPRTWQAAILTGIPGKDIKESSRFSALQLAPDLEKQLTKSKSGRYDAINIAYYLSTQRRG